MSNLQRRLGHRFSSSELLLTALTHRSYANERDIPNNERLEFLGDSVLQLVVTRHLFSQYPYLREGQMTRVRAAVVRKESLALVAEALELGDASGWEKARSNRVAAARKAFWPTPWRL